MEIISLLVLAMYCAALLGLAAYSLHRGWLLWLYRRPGRSGITRARWDRSLPPITVQLPVYNERFVVGRLIDAACALDYPRDRLEIQVLDDSDDETRELIARRVRARRADGTRIEHLRRGSRAGYKAGALAYGLERAQGDFVLILDADFVPPADLLRRMLPPLADGSVGMVQARWGHLNEGTSWFTRAQALILDAHFHIEHGARAAAGLFFNFNGTAGLWRRSCLHDAGGWQADTLTEDLDLSYRAQMRGWRFVYLADVVVPGELPEVMRAFKSQQARWARGSIETARKLMPDLWAGDWPLRLKLEALAHLTSYAPSLLTLALSMLILPAMIVRLGHGWPAPLWVDGSLFALLLAPLIRFYGTTRRLAGRRAWPGLAIDLPLILALGIGISVNNSRALLSGVFGRSRAEFIRTPKLGGSTSKGRSAEVDERGGTRAGYRARANWWNTAAETALAAYVAVAVLYSLNHGLYPSIPFLLLFLYGFASVAAGSILDRRRAFGARA